MLTCTISDAKYLSWSRNAFIFSEYVPCEGGEGWERGVEERGGGEGWGRGVEERGGGDRLKRYIP